MAESHAFSMELENVLDIPAHFQEFFNEADLSSEKCVCGWVFWKADRDDHNQEISIQQKIKGVLLQVTGLSYFELWWQFNYLLQFWAPKEVEGRCYLTTSDQPFALAHLDGGLCRYRKHCMGHRYVVGSGSEKELEELGPPARVFRNGHPECSPDLQLYQTTEYPNRDHAIDCGVTTYVALPVFDSLRKECLGVLEILITTFDRNQARDFEIAMEIALKLQDANLKLTHSRSQPSLPWLSFLRPQPRKADQQVAVTEIKEMLKLATSSSEILLAQAWVPCNKCADINANLSCMERALYACNNELYDDYRFVDWWMLRNFQKVERGKGIFGILLASEHKSCFCPYISGFSITEQPLAHCTQQAGLDVCFAICLQSSYTGNELCILEFFLEQGTRNCEHLCYVLLFLRSIMKQTLKSFKVASGKQLEEELVVEVITSGNNYGFASSKLPQCDMFPTRFETIPYRQEMEHQQVDFTSDRLDSDRNVAEAEQNNIVTTNLEEEVTITTTKRKRKSKNTRLHISHEDIRQKFGKKLGEASKELGVSKSTLKRACRDYGINRWPSNEKNKNNPSLFEATTANKRVRGSKQQKLASSRSKSPPLSDSPLHLRTDIIESSQHVTELPEANAVTVKATFENDTVKFQLCTSSGMEKLNEEVARRLNLKSGSFKLKYQDEASEWILLSFDDDLQFCIKTLTSLGKTPIKVLVQPIHV